MYALADHKPGEVVTAIVKRAGQDVAIDITLGARPDASR
jgi:hypothetical protein